MGEWHTGSDIRSEWHLVEIGGIAQVVGGSTPSTKDPTNFGGDIPWITPKDLSGPHDRYVTGGKRNLTRKGLASCSAKLVPPGTVLLTTRAPVGYVAIAGNQIATNQGFRNLILRDGVSPGFVYYWLKANTEELLRHASGSTFTELSGSSLKQIHMLLPEESEQRAIAHILGTLDDKIELNRRMNETLEEMARAIFKSWFVDFDPVRAKMDGSWRRGESLPGMPAEMYDLFPSRLVDSELGEIPEGWEVSEIGREVEVVGGGTPSTKDMSFWDGGNIHWATPKDLSRLQSLILIETERKITSVGLKKISSGLLPVGTVLMSSRAPVGYLAIAQVPLAVNQGFIAMKCDERISREYTLFWCSENMNIIKAHASGTTFQEISKRNFRLLKVLVPTTGVLRVFDNMVNSLFERITLNLHESRTLAGLRDTLLPKLISGELRVRDAEKFMESVV